MIKERFYLQNVLLFITLILAACGESEPQSGQHRQPTVAVLLEPYRYLVEQIAGGRFEVAVLVPAGNDPHVYQPTVNDMRLLALCRLYFKVAGAPAFPLEEKFIEADSAIQVVDLRQNLTLRRGQAAADYHDEHFGYAEQRQHNSGHSAVDPHIWLGTEEVKIQLQSITAALTAADPDGKELFESNLSHFLERIARLEEKAQRQLQHLAGSAVFVYHPSFAYFLDRYNIDQIAIESFGKEPTASQLAAFVEQAQRLAVKTIFIEPQFSRRGAEVIAQAIEARLVILDPLAYNWEENISKITDALADR